MSTHLSEFLVTEAINADLAAAEKEGAIREIVSALHAQKAVSDVEGTVEVLLEREKLGSTGIGQNIAVPHAKSEGVDRIILGIGISRNGVDFDALDGDPVHIIFLVLAPIDSTGMHLKVLARIARLLKDKVFRNALRECGTAEELLKTIREEDERVV